MPKTSRRSFLAATAMTLPSLCLLAEAGQSIPASLTVPRAANGPQMPTDFVGLSYEVQQLTDPTFFSPQNTGLIKAFKDLSPHGVLRLGGNTSEFAWWQPTPTARQPEHPQTREVEGEPQARYYPVTPLAVDKLAGFLNATGWTCLYGIGMGTNTPARAADEAEYVAGALGSRLQYFQIGNEVDLFNRHLRDPKTWSAKTYLDEWLGLARAVAARVPSAKFGIPDVAGDVAWLTEIARLWPSVKNPPVVTTLSHHHYFGGPATNPDVNIPRLLSAETRARVQKTATIARAAADAMAVRVRMTEGNTCYRGGKPGVSDVFAAALWSADYALQLASNNYSGINLHGGTGMSVANSVGGFLPGDVMLREQGRTEAEIADHPHPFYTPIASFGDSYVLEPVAHGLKFAGQLSGGTLLPMDAARIFAEAGINATAYAAQLPAGHPSLIILNRDAEKDLHLTVRFEGRSSGKVEVERLLGAALDSREAVITRQSERERLKNGAVDMTVRKASGARMTLV